MTDFLGMGLHASIKRLFDDGCDVFTVVFDGTQKKSDMNGMLRVVSVAENEPAITVARFRRLNDTAIVEKS